jgi:hypothetical protein
MAGNFWVVVAAVVTALVTYSNLVASKERDISEGRRKWLELITHEIGTLLGQVDLLMKLVEVELPAGRRPLSSSELKTFRNVHKDEYRRLSEAYHVVRLRLNAETHKELLSKIEVLNNLFYGTCANMEEILLAQRSVTECAQAVSSEVWTRMKTGDKEYIEAKERTARGYRALLLLLFVTIAYMIWSTALKPAESKRTSTTNAIGSVP